MSRKAVWGAGRALGLAALARGLAVVPGAGLRARGVLAGFAVRLPLACGASEAGVGVPSAGAGSSTWPGRGAFCPAARCTGASCFGAGCVLALLWVVLRGALGGMGLLVANGLGRPFFQP
ncbi:hypothetical protein [Acetobacter sp.]|uniref:hypothetical protein n=1 Tax=Acetobacter sp. TaxID=440 RepID=UPI0039EAC5BB